MMQPQKVNSYFFFFLLIALTTAFFKVISPFLIDLIVTAVLATVFMPVYDFLTKKTKGRKHLSAAITTLVVALGVVVPITVMGFLIIQEVGDYLHFLQNNIEKLPDIRELLAGFTLLNDYREQISAFDFQRWLGDSLNRLTSIILPITQNAFMNLTRMVFNFLIVLILLFFFFIDGQELVHRIRSLLPLKYRDQDIFITRFKSITSATIKGLLFIAVMEAAVGGVIFTLIHFPAPMIWVFIMLILSILPIVGTNLVLLPIALYKLYMGHYSASAVLIAGVVFVLISQYVIKPAIIGNRSDLHPAMILISTLGGLVWLGTIGVIVGPVLAAFFISVWAMFESHFKTGLEENRRYWGDVG
ncbi:MAG: hypothetical protein A2293_14250 [Elusimicrobia bacterium RIFOXYB2_FULL_49_7]|nr:MAG: hypothetical protein A2293_14250 [Elusimicrobia bacterium RIFOXYB2_FULL_49_7]